MLCVILVAVYCFAPTSCFFRNQIIAIHHHLDDTFRDKAFCYMTIIQAALLLALCLCNNKKSHCLTANFLFLDHQTTHCLSARLQLSCQYCTQSLCSSMLSKWNLRPDLTSYGNCRCILDFRLFFHPINLHNIHVREQSGIWVGPHGGPVYLWWKPHEK